MTEPISARWRHEHGTGPERRSWRGAVLWSCPGGCGGELSESDGGMRCGSCGEVFSYARLAAEHNE